MGPGSKTSGTNIRDSEDYLSVQEAKEYASIAGTLLYHALDRPDLQFAVGRLMSAVTKPQRKHLAMMKHCLRYMLGRCCCTWVYDYQEWPGELVILTDADWASDSERWGSVDCVHIYHGGHLIESSTSTQQVVSISTAEREFYAIVRGAASGIQLREAFTQLGFPVQLRVLSDSSAARAMTARTGSGRVKHVEARYLWLQERVRKKQFSVGCIDTSHNTADLGTKFRSGERLQEFVRMMPIVVGEFEPTKIPRKLLGSLFLASQVTQAQGNDEIYEKMKPHYCVLELVCIFGFISGVLMVIIVRFVASSKFGGRYAESPVNCVEVGTQVDLLACDEQLDEELTNSRLLQPELVALAGLFERIWARRTVVAMEVTQTGLMEKREMWYPGNNTYHDYEERRRVEIVAVWQSVAHG